MRYLDRVSRIYDPAPRPIIRVMEIAHGVAWWIERVEAGARLVVEVVFEHAERVGELLHGPRADDRRGDSRLVLAP